MITSLPSLFRLNIIAFTLVRDASTVSIHRKIFKCTYGQLWWSNQWGKWFTYKLLLKFVFSGFNKCRIHGYVWWFLIVQSHIKKNYILDRQTEIMCFFQRCLADRTRCVSEQNLAVTAQFRMHADETISMTVTGRQGRQRGNVRYLDCNVTRTNVTSGTSFLI